MKKIIFLALILCIGSVMLFSGCEKTPQTTQYAITIAGGLGGEVTGSGLYNEGNTVTITATPDENYVFWHWISHSEVLSTQTTYTFTATEHTDIVAYFVLEDQTHLAGEYYVHSLIDSVGRVLNTSETIMKYTLNEDNTYESQSFSESEGVYLTEETGTYHHDNGSSVYFTTGGVDTYYSYDIEEETSQLALNCSKNVWTTLTLMPMPEDPVTKVATYQLLSGVVDGEDIVMDDEEPEIFAFHSDGTFHYSYYTNSILVERTGTYEILGLSLILTEGVVGEEVYTIYEFYCYDNGGIVDARMVFENKDELNLITESRIFALIAD